MYIKIKKVQGSVMPNGTGKDRTDGRVKEENKLSLVVYITSRLLQTLADGK